ncbi:hypothetical protein ACK8HX_14535 [Oryzobacter sp. R7]|uniref:hypothetical protein n=1 Tax=Oryzobacter faecalis TaxID=3388656 RepID=UPI00398CB11E
MRVPSVRTGVVAVVAGVVLVAGCGSSEGDGGASSAAGSASASPSPSESESTAVEAVTEEARKRASSATKKALLPTDAFEKIGLEQDMAPKEDTWDWFESCRPFLASESRQVTGHHGRWKGEGAVVDQTVVAYPDGIAEDIVAEVKKTVTCTEYSAGDQQYTKVATASLPEGIDADASHAWCMHSSEDYEVCHSVIARQDLVSSIWVIESTKGEALDALGVMTQLAAKRIAVQVS